MVGGLVAFVVGGRSNMKEKNWEAEESYHT